MAETKEYVLKIQIGGSGAKKLKEKEDEEGKNPTVRETLQSVIKTTKSLAAATGVSIVAGQVLNYVSGRVEIETGNSQLQDEINAAKKIGGQISAIAMGAIFGGLAGAGLATLSVGVDYMLSVDSYNFNKKLNAAQLSIQRERAGLAWAVNNSRRV